MCKSETPQSSQFPIEKRPGGICSEQADVYSSGTNSELSSSAPYRAFIYSYKAFMRTRQCAFRCQLFVVVVQKTSGTQAPGRFDVYEKQFKWKFSSRGEERSPSYQLIYCPDNQEWASKVNFRQYTTEVGNQFKQFKQWHLCHS